MKTILLMSGSLLGLGLAGCAEVLDIPDDPQVVGPWRCLSEPLQEPVPSATTAEVKVQACDFTNQCSTSVRGLTARLCRQLDPNCNNPVQQGITDSNGLLTFTVPTPLVGFSGYLDVMSSTANCMDPQFGEFGPMMCGMAMQQGCRNPEDPEDLNCQVPLYARALLFFNPPIFNKVEEPMQLPLIPAAGMPAMLEAAGAQLDPSKGNLFVTALDCDGQRAAGVTYTLKDNPTSVTQLYVHGGQPNKNDLETDASGVGGFLGVPAGFANVTGYNQDQDVVGESGVTAAPFAMTYTAITPF
ncbi:MAG TPA: hypothetical protein VMG12_09745 [Polyangiaceae bacterium]|nr:hypothetical protein [Polyangiaceae bacterium]